MSYGGSSMRNLYDDVFFAVRDDDEEHVGTMLACMGDIITTPVLEKNDMHGESLCVWVLGKWEGCGYYESTSLLPKYFVKYTLLPLLIKLVTMFDTFPRWGTPRTSCPLHLYRKVIFVGPHIEIEVDGASYPFR